MGMIANYQFMTDEQLNALKNFKNNSEELLEEVEEWGEQTEIFLDIDKMWDVLHFVLTGVDSSNPIPNNPLSEAVVGVQALENISEFVAYTEKARIADVLSALEAFDMDQALSHFSMEACKKAELYPDIWDYDDEKDEIIEEIADYFESMKDFYREVLAAKGSVMVTIY